MLAQGMIEGAERKKDQVMTKDHVVIRTYDLTKRFKKLTAVDNLNMEVYQGEVFGFLGPNGAGKTTAISILLISSSSKCMSWAR